MKIGLEDLAEARIHAYNSEVQFWTEQDRQQHAGRIAPSIGNGAIVATAASEGLLSGYVPEIPDELLK